MRSQIISHVVAITSIGPVDSNVIIKPAVYAVVNRNVMMPLTLIIVVALITTDRIWTHVARQIMAAVISVKRIRRKARWLWVPNLWIVYHIVIEVVGVGTVVVVVVAVLRMVVIIRKSSVVWWRAEALRGGTPAAFDCRWTATI